MDALDFQTSGAHNLGAAQVISHAWNGIAVHSIHVEALPGRSWHQISCDRPVLAIVVNEVGGRCEARLAIGRDQPRRRTGRQTPVGHMSLIPADLSVWGYSDTIAQVDVVRLILDLDQVEAIMGEEFAQASFTEPRLMFNDESLQALARLLAIGEDKSQWSALFGDSLVTAMIARLSNLSPQPGRNHRRLGLTMRQLSDVTDFIRANLTRPIRLSELATLAGLSPSQFGRAFKTSTGTTPHQWHLDARIESAKQMLDDPRISLVDVALEAGFSEQSHFSRAFRTATGASPSVWRRQRAA